MDIIACGLFLLLIVGMDGARGSKLRQQLSSYTRIALPVYAFFFAIDRPYQWYRYGSIFNTYLDVFAQQLKERNHDLRTAGGSSEGAERGLLGASTRGRWEEPMRQLRTGIQPAVFE